MTIKTLISPRNNKSTNLRKIMLIIIVTISLIVSQYIIKATSHAFKKHRLEVQSSMECLDAKGSSASYKVFEHREERRTWTCFDDIDWYIIVTTTAKGEGIDREYNLRTTFKLTDKTIEEYEAEIIRDKGAIQVQEELEAGQLFFEWQ